MILFVHGFLLFFSSLSLFLVYKGRTLASRLFGSFMFFALPVAGVYFIGWWALLTYFVGLCAGAWLAAGSYLNKNKPRVH